MLTIETMFYLAGIILLVINILYYKSTKKFFRNACVGILTGLIALVPAHYILDACGISLMMNYASASASALLGIPGVILMVVYTVAL